MIIAGLKIISRREYTSNSYINIDNKFWILINIASNYFLPKKRKKSLNLLFSP